MSKDPQQDDDKLGHDPLEWLSEEASPEAADSGVVQDTSELATPHIDDTAEEVDEPGKPETDVETVETNFEADEKLTVQGVENAYEQMVNWVSRVPAGEILTLDLAQTADMDSSGYQLLVSLANTCQKDGRQLQLVNVNPTVVGILSKMGDRLLRPLMADS